MTRRTPILPSAAAVLLLLLSPRALAWETPRYQAIDIGSLAGRQMVPTDINMLGDVVGYAYDQASQQAFFYQHRSGSLLVLTAVGGSHSSAAFGINDHEEIVGQSDHRGVIWYPNGGRRVPGPYPAGTLLDLRAINNSGVAVGVALIQVFGQAVRLSRNLQGMQAFLAPHLTLNAYPAAINGSGVIVGTTEDSAFFWAGGRLIELWRLLPSNTSDSAAADVNDGGEMVGTFLGPIGSQLVTQSFLFRRGRITVLRDTRDPGGGFRASGIDDAGEIVGTESRSGRPAAYLYRNGSFFKLSLLVTNMAHGFCIRFADAINNRGWIAARGCDGRVYLLVRTG